MDPFSILERKISSFPITGYDLYWIQTRQLSLESQEGEIELAQNSVSHGLAIQLYSKGKIGFASTTQIAEPFLERALSVAYNSLEIVEEGIPSTLPGSLSSSGSLESDRGLANRPWKEKARIVQSMEQAARSFDPRITRTRSARYEEEEMTVRLKNSAGFDHSYHKTVCELSLMVMAEEKGCQEMAWESNFSTNFEGLDPEKPARRASERAVALLGAKPLTTRKSAALLSPQVGASLLSVLSASFLGDQVAKGKSILRNKTGEALFSPLLSIEDDGRYRDGFGSAPFDGEGTQTGRTSLVEKGVLKNFLHDLNSAARLQGRPTGNASRSVFKERPRVGVTNFYIRNGETAAGELFSKMQSGFYITDLIGLHTANPVTGDFSLGATGFWKEGSTQQPVRGVAISGNLHELFRKVSAVGDDLHFEHSYGSPTLLISELDIGGA